MAFEGLTDRLQKAMEKLRRKPKVTEADLRETMREIRLALLEADVNFTVVKDFVKKVREKAAGADVLKGLNPAQQIVKIVNDELTELMGEEAVPLNKAAHIPTVIMMVGLQGAGKTTTAGKLALRLKNEDNARPMFIAADVYRPAAITQLKQVADQIDVPVFEKGTDVDPVEIVREGMEVAKQNHNDYVIIDTAGRLQIDEQLMDELANIKELVNPDEILLVIDSMTGQNAVNTAQGFDDKLDITGVVLTKLDGDTRGGAALSIRTVVTKPIKFIGTGEKMEAIDVFHPARMADRILGMGDVVSLVERAQEQFDLEEAKKLEKKIRKNQFDFNDFYNQIQQIKKMGNIKDLAAMIPGVGKAIRDVDIPEDAFKGIEAIILSMTPKERTNPAILNTSRRQRIAKGSGTNIQEVNKLIKQFDQTRKMMQMMTGNKMAQMMSRMKGMPGMPKMPGM